MEILGWKTINPIYGFPSRTDSAEDSVNALEDMSIEKYLNCSTEKTKNKKYRRALETHRKQ